MMNWNLVSFEPQYLTSNCFFAVNPIVNRKPAALVRKATGEIWFYPGDPLTCDVMSASTACIFMLITSAIWDSWTEAAYQKLPGMWNWILTASSPGFGAVPHGWGHGTGAGCRRRDGHGALSWPGCPEGPGAQAGGGCGTCTPKCCPGAPPRELLAGTDVPCPWDASLPLGCFLTPGVFP